MHRFAPSDTARLLAIASLSCCMAVRAEAPDVPDARFAWHAQATYVEQETNRFRAPYSGPNSLVPDQGRQTSDVTLYAGMRLGSRTEIWINPEIEQGFGVANTLGLAGFASGEAYKVGRARPYLRWQRLFVRHTWNLAGESGAVDAGPNRFAVAASDDRLVLTAGKFAVGDVFDTNRYAHDPRADFLNWSLIDAGSFDYAADAWGYTVGAALEWYRGRWTLRGGFFDVSDVPNSTRLEPGFGEYQVVGELERRFEGGRIALTGYSTHARLARLDEATAAALASGSPADPAPLRRPGQRSGASLNLELEVADGVGVFARAGIASGNVEAYDFTDIDRTVAGGLSLGGARWRRPGDTLGVAAVANGISAQRRRYLDAGGLGILVGDGRLPRAAAERIIETFYSVAITGAVRLTADYQRIANPAYNRDRGPVSLWALRFHVET